jgi:hypothetical protein
VVNDESTALTVGPKFGAPKGRNPIREIERALTRWMTTHYSSTIQSVSEASDAAQEQADAGQRTAATMTDHLESLHSLHQRGDARADSRVASDRWAAHEAVLDRLAANIRVAQMHGWTSCAIVRIDGARRFSAWGVPPGQGDRHPVPDWTAEPTSKGERRPGE